MPVLITRESVAREVPERFAEQYGPEFGRYHFGDSREIYEKLCSLKQPDVAGVESLMPGWTSLRCDDCESLVDAVVAIGEHPADQSAVAQMCETCVGKAMLAFRQLQTNSE